MQRQIRRIPKQGTKQNQGTSNRMSMFGEETLEPGGWIPVMIFCTSPCAPRAHVSSSERSRDPPESHDHQLTRVRRAVWRD